MSDGNMRQKASMTGITTETALTFSQHGASILVMADITVGDLQQS